MSPDQSDTDGPLTEDPEVCYQIAAPNSQTMVSELRSLTCVAAQGKCTCRNNVTRDVEDFWGKLFYNWLLDIKYDFIPLCDIQNIRCLCLYEVRKMCRFVTPPFMRVRR